jgi:xylulokinase
MSFLSIDIGTSGCKAAAFNENGNLLAHAFREYPVLYPSPGWAELDSREVFSKVSETIQEVSACTGQDPIRALCVSSLGEAAVPVSRREGILGSSILSCDTRGAEYAADLGRKMGEAGFYAKNFNVLSPSYTFPKLAWTRDHFPDLFNRAEKFLLWDGLVGYLLGCEPFISHSCASRTLLFDLKAGAWSGPLMEAAGLKPEKLPVCLPAGTIAGKVSVQAAERFGIPSGCAVVVGGHDQCCNALGAGITEAGGAVDGIGTYECITPVYDKLPKPEKMRILGLNVENHVVPGLYVSFLFNQAGLLIRWFRDTFAAAEKHMPDIYNRLEREMPERPTRLITLPYFCPTGSPGYISNASGVIAGLKADTRRGEIYKSVMESVTFYFAEYLERMKRLGIHATEFTATGGGACSEAWLQIKSDILGVPYHRLTYTESGLAGCAILSGVALGIYSSYAEGAKVFVKRDRTFVPNPGRHAEYQERLAGYQKLFPLMRGYLEELGRLVA